jgi:hypothetical protein
MASEFHEHFAQTVLAAPGGAAPAALRTLEAQPGFAVYRNTVMKGLIDALQANFPTVTRLTGEAWFRAAAAEYARATPPDDPVLLKYGASFPAFLAAFEPARELTYLPGVARLDQLWCEAHIARGEPLVDAAVLAAMPPEKLAVTVLYPHAAARWVWFDHAPVYSIWARNRGGFGDGDEPWEPAWHAEGALITRARDHVEWIALDAAAHAFIERCARGGTIADAAAAALAIEPGADLQRISATLLGAGAFSRLSASRSRLEKK